MIDTEPQSARVKVNGEYIGKSPITWIVPRKQVGFIGRGVLIEALPVGENQFSQREKISFRNRDYRNPIKVFLDLRLDTVAPKRRIEINEE